jgi:hypothetical protein
MPASAEGIGDKRLPLLARVILIALGLNVVAWIGASLGAGAQASWKYVSLLLFFLIGLVIGRRWAMLVTVAFGIIHAIPVYLGWIHGYLSTWGEALWWAFAMVLLVLLTGLGVLTRKAIGRLQARWAR